jgi:hypothetical protein
MNEVTLFLPVPRFHITEVIHFSTSAPQTAGGRFHFATKFRPGGFLLENLFLNFDAGYKHTQPPSKPRPCEIFQQLRQGIYTLGNPNPPRKTQMKIPTEPIGSILRPLELIEAIGAAGDFAGPKKGTRLAEKIFGNE